MQKNELTTAERFYIEQHHDKMVVADIAAQLKLEPKDVLKYVKQLQKKTQLPKSSEYGTSHTVVMDEAASKAGDEASAVQTNNERLAGKFKDCIWKIPQ